MSKRVYATTRAQADQFPDCDELGWFIDIPEYEFEQMYKSGVISFDGNKYVASKAFVIPAVETGGGIYPNPGATLKGIATLICVLGMVASVILAVVFGYSTSLFGDFNFGVFFGILIGGGVLSYLSGLGLAAFGDLVLSANEIKRKLK